MNREKYLFSLRLHGLAWIDRYLHIFSKKKGNYFLFYQFFWWWLYSIMERAGGGENGKQGNCYTPHQGNRGTMVSFSPSTLKKESKRLESFIGWLTPTKGRERPHDWPAYIESYPHARIPLKTIFLFFSLFLIFLSTGLKTYQYSRHQQHLKNCWEDVKN